MHTLMVKNPRALGEKKFCEKDILYYRSERKRRLKKRSRVRRCILNAIEDLVSENKVVTVSVKMECVNKWHNYTRNRKNNLGLK